MAAPLSAITELAKDPSLVPGVYNYCDQWCAYCAVKVRCLVWRVRRRWEGSGGARSAETLGGAAEFTREIGTADGQGSPQLDAMLSGTWRPSAAGSRKPHRVQRRAWRYAMDAEVFLIANRWKPRPGSHGGISRQPSACDVIAWYHLMIWVKVMRALDGVASTEAGEADWRSDALGSAKVALIGIDRSRAALRKLAKRGSEEAEPLLKQLEELESLVEKTFPGARTFIRNGLDPPAM